MNIAIVGYGKMGHEIETVIRESTDHTISAIAVQNEADVLRIEQLQDADVAIDFSAAELMQSHIEQYCRAGVNAVIGTTGWTYDRDELNARANEAGIGIIVGSNFSAGVQTYLAILRQASKRLNALGNYDVFGYEAHHTEKADSPSGTAKTIAAAILDEFDSKSTVLYGNAEGKIRDDELQIVSQRGGKNSGLHSITFENGVDQIQITHQAFGRSGFAQGAVAAAELAKSRKGLIMYEELFNEGEVYGG